MNQQPDMQPKPEAELVRMQQRTAELEKAEIRLREAEEALRRKTHQFEALRLVSAEIARELNITDLLGIILRSAVRLLNARTGFLLLYDEETKTLTPGYWEGHGDWVRNLSFPLEQGIAGTVAAQRLGMVVNDYRSRPNAMPLILENTEVTSVVAEPLIYRDRIVGVVTVDNEGMPERIFREADREILTPFAVQAAIAIENARLFDAAKRELAERTRTEKIMAAQRDLGVALTEALSLPDAFRLCLDASMDLGEFDAGAIYRIDPVSGEWGITCIRGISDRFAERVRLDGFRYSGPRDTLQGNPLYIEGEAIPTLRYREALLEEGIRSLALIPIRGQAQIIGYLAVASRVSDRIPDYIRNALETIAGQIAAFATRAQSEEALRESESKFRDLAEKSMAGVYLVQDGLYKYVNGEFAKIFGYAVEELIDRMGPKDLTHPEDLALVEDRIRKRISGEIQSLRYNFRIRTKDHQVKHVEVYSSRTLYQGSPALIGTILDITDHLKTEEELKRLSFAIEQAAEDIVITDPDGLIQYVNPAFENITGYSRGEAIGRTPRLLKSGIHNRAFYDHLWNTIKAGKIWRGRITNRCKDGRLVQEDATISPMLNSVGKLTGYIALKRDVTETIKIETQLRQAQKMEAIGTLAGGIAHDFNNILGAMMGYTELAKFKTTDETIHSYLDQVLRACDRSRDLVRQILTFSRQREQEKKPVAVTPIVKEALKLLRSSLPTTVEIRQFYANRRDTVLADPTQIHQVLINLCTNAVYAMRDREGVLEVRLEEQCFQTAHPAYDTELREGAYLQMVVSDTGEGMEPAVKEKIFDPFFTTKLSGEGTGLGLSVVYGIVKGCGGGISVESEPGKGTVFTIFLPLLDAGEEKEEAERAVIPRGQGCILYVDDEEPIASLSQEMLTSLGYEVVVRFSSRDALAAFQSHPWRYDLVITDMTMPNMTGAVLAREMLKIRAGLPIILTTGFSERIDEEEAKRIGIHAFLMKPVSLSALAQTVKQVLEAVGKRSDDEP